MAINVTPPNLSGLAAYAGRGSGGLNLPSVAGIGLGAFQAASNAQAQKQRSALELMRLQQEGQAGLLANQNQRDQLQLDKYKIDKAAQIDQQRLLQDAQQNQDTLGYNRDVLDQAQNQFNVTSGQDQQRIALDAQKQHFAELLTQKKEDLQNKGAFASYARLAINNAASPEEANQIRTSILDEAKQKGYITPQEAKMAAGLPISQFKNTLDQQIIATGMASQYKDMYDMYNPKTKAGVAAGQTRTLPDGTVVQSSAPSSANITQIQKDLGGAIDNLKELNNLYSNVPDNFFGASAAKQSATKIGEWAQNLPIIGKLVQPSEKSKQELSSYNSLKGASEMLALQTIKQLSGVQYSDKQLEFMKKILPDIGPTTVKSEFDGRVQNLQRFFDRIKSDRESLLSQGYQVGSSQYNDAMKNLMDQHMGESTLSSKQQDKLNAYKKMYPDRSDAEILAAMKKQGV